MSTRAFVTLFLLQVMATPLVALPAPEVPEPLRPWVPWVLDRHPDLACPRLDEAALCLWPGRLRLSLADAGGSFRLDVDADADAVVELPGDAVHWPSEVTVDGAPALLRHRGSRPAVAVGAGRHQLAGRFRWTRPPESLAVPSAVAVVELRWRDRDIPRPRREDDGRLWLGESRDDAEEADRLSLAVHRLLADGVPLRLETRIVFYATGGARAVELPSPLPDGFVATDLDGELPARWLDGGHLLVQVRPGIWELRLEARSRTPMVEIPFGERPEPWPPEELWSFRAAPALRAVEIQGAPGVDPRRTALPEDWHDLPTYRLTPGHRLHFEELSRGADAPSDLLRVARRVWLADGGRYLAVEDVIEGQVTTAGRLEALAPGELGRARLDRRIRGRYQGYRPDDLREQVLTVRGEDGAAPSLPGGTIRPGITVQPGPLYLQAELVYPRGRALPAVGWSHEAERLKLDLQLPLGWTLLAAWGADHATGSWSDGFSPLDVLLLLLLGLFTWHRLGWRWGLAVTVFFILGLQEPFGRIAAVVWLGLLSSGTESAAGGIVRRTLRWLLAAAGIVLFVFFAAVQWRTGLHPEFQLPMPKYVYEALSEQGLSNTNPFDVHPAEDEWWSVLDAPPPPRPEGPGAGTSDERHQPVDPEEVVQTGFGIPHWMGKTCHLYWNGQVTPDHEIRLWLLPPAVELVLSLLRAMAALVLTAWLCRWHGKPPFAKAAEGSAAALVVGVGLSAVFLTAPVKAQEPAPREPTAPFEAVGLLAELEDRLTRPPDCHPSCVEVPLLRLAPKGGELHLTAEVHAAATTAWRLPGPAANWTPRQVTVDGAGTVALRRGENGFLVLRLPPGRHRVEAAGPAADAVDLVMPQPPRRLDFAGEGWMLSGTAPGEPPPGAVRLDRLPTADTVAGGDRVDQPFDPCLELHRRIVVGLPWQVHSELRRRGSGEGMVAVRVPLLEGETVTTPGVTVEDGMALIRLEPGQSTRVFQSQLREREALRLRAPRDQPWFERWELDCSPIWSCRAEGLPGRQFDRQAERPWTPVWQPWPGEELVLGFSRPRPAGGPTATVDKASLRWTAARHSQGELALEVRTSVAKERIIRLPPAAELEFFAVDGEPQAMRFDDGRLRFTLPPGEHRVAVRWREERSAGLLARPPVIAAGAVANVEVGVKVPSDRRVLAAGGPGCGPVIESWTWLLLAALVAVVLRRRTEVPVAVHEWLLLALGVLQLPRLSALMSESFWPSRFDLGWWPPWPLGPVALVVVMAWLMLSGSRVRPAAWAMALLAGFAVVLLGATVAVGLHAEPAVHVEPVSPEGIPFRAYVDDTLVWYVDRADEALPRPWVLWLPSWAWRGLVLLWATWLVSRLAAWSPWLWKAPRSSQITDGKGS